MLYSLQYGRAFAAILVVYSHLSGFVQFAPLANDRIGSFGVDIFFVISGFIMWNTAQDSTLGEFWLRRIIRIVPSYWLYTLLLVVLAVLPGGLAPNVDVALESVAKSLLFIPYFNGRFGIQPLLLQGWTLNFEIYFYFVFGLVLLLPISIRLVSILMFFVSAVALGTLHMAENAIYLTYTDSMIIEFLFGIGLALLLPRWPMGHGVSAALVASSIVGFTLFSFDGVPQAPRFLVYGLPATLFIAGLVSLEPLVHRRPAKRLSLIGDASYSLYLSHPFVLKGVAVGFATVGLRGAESALAAILFGIAAIVSAVIFSLLSYTLIERPLGRALARACTARGC